MRLLLDTQVVLWQLAGSRTISSAAREAIEQATDLLFSVVSFAEIGVKAAAGKLSVPRDLREHRTAASRSCGSTPIMAAPWRTCRCIIVTLSTVCSSPRPVPSS